MRRKGIAARLLGHVMHRAMNQGLLTACLEVRVSNVAAVDLYHRFGFSRKGLRRAYYHDGEDALLMEFVA
jgi:ribosomal-protein-alanine N-acetyltransferase